MDNNDEMATAMQNLSYRHTLGQLFSRHMMPGLMPAGSAAGTSATFNAPQPAAHLAATYNHPIHIPRTCIDALPAACGVYTFRGANDIPLYVGRSVNLRSRVLAHLHGQEDPLLVRQTQHIETRRCAGELGAALLETSLRRQLQPLHNKKTRNKRGLWTLRLDELGHVAVDRVDTPELRQVEDLFGLYASQRAATEALQTLVEQHGLCTIACGLEHGAPGMACFNRQIRRCRGACTGEESHAEHHTRLLEALQALRMVAWPYQGPMGIVERAEDGYTQVHVIDRWRYLGSLDSEHRSLPPAAAHAKAGFDLDCYKIVIQPYLLGQLELRSLPSLASRG